MAQVYKPEHLIMIVRTDDFVPNLRYRRSRTSEKLFAKPNYADRKKKGENILSVSSEERCVTYARCDLPKALSLGFDRRSMGVAGTLDPSTEYGREASDPATTGDRQWDHVRAVQRMLVENGAP
jgi:hypothetical protein